MNGLLVGDDVATSVQLVGSAGGSRTVAGTYPLGLALSGVDAGNYLLAANPGGSLTSFTINPIVLGLSPSFLDQTYGSFSTEGYLTGGILPGDAVTVYTNLGNGLVSSLPSTLAAGSYGIKLTGLAGANAGGYVISPAAAAGETLEIDQRPVSFTGSTSLSYGTIFTAGVFGNLLTGILPQDAGALR